MLLAYGWRPFQQQRILGVGAVRWRKPLQAVREPRDLGSVPIYVRGFLATGFATEGDRFGHVKCSQPLDR